MKTRIKTPVVIAMVALALEGWALYVLGASHARWHPALIVQDEKEAHARYDAMVEAVRTAKTLSYTSVCSGPDERTSRYQVWLKRPDAFRVVLSNSPSANSTTLVGDGTALWIYWSGDRPYLRTDSPASYDEARSDVYMRKPALMEGNSISTEIAALGVAWFEAIFDPSLFHGRRDTGESHLDGIRSRGADSADGETCDVIEVSYARAQRTRFYWLSRRDHFPRRIKEVIRLAEPRVIVEEWSEVTIDGEIPPKMFMWSPPAGWRQFNPPVETGVTERAKTGP